VAAACPHRASPTQRALRRQDLRQSRCGSSARRDLSGGRPQGGPYWIVTSGFSYGFGQGAARIGRWMRWRPGSRPGG
jgi:hypothetical protein